VTQPPCTLGVGCDDYGVCFASNAGAPEQCGRPAEAAAPQTSAEVPFTPRLPPLSHQATYLSRDARRPFFALFWEQGLGKTKALIDNIALLLMEGKINGALVLAPNGVHRNWVVEEIPKHWPVDAPPYASFSWDTNKSANKGYGAEFAAFNSTNHFPILCMSYDSLMTDAGKQASWDFIKSRDVMAIGDESQRFKTPASKRNKRLFALSAYPKYRRIASGTPMDMPFDIYTQVRFLDPWHWARKFAIGSFTAFKSCFAEIVQRKIVTNTGAERTFPHIVGYRNLDQLAVAVSEIGSRYLKEDVLDLPPKTYSRLFHELTPAQWRAYNDLKAEALTVMDSGELVTAEMALVLRLRLRQVTSGFIREGAGTVDIPFVPNPRARALKTFLEDYSGPTIIWADFTHDTRLCAAVSKAAGRRPAIFDGTRPGEAVDAFHRGEVDDLIANLGSNMREGYTLNEAKHTLYYSRNSKLLNRQQSEDRNHRIGQNDHVTYLDFLAEGTADLKELTDLREKRSLTGQVLGDAAAVTDNWLSPAEVSNNIKDWFREALS
jgi:hypothetical protein